MRGLSDDKKWTLVLNEARMKWEEEQSLAKRRIEAAEHGAGARALPEKNTPQWSVPHSSIAGKETVALSDACVHSSRYVQKFMDGSITSKQVASLQVSLRTQPVV